MESQQKPLLERYAATLTWNKFAAERKLQSLKRHGASLLEEPHYPEFELYSDHDRCDFGQTHGALRKMIRQLLCPWD